jgi:sodium/hydrogen antiporter
MFQAMVWYLAAGVLLLIVAIVGSRVERLPLTPAVLYLFAGAGLGPWVVGLIDVDPLESAAAIERFTEVALIISVFGAGLRLRVEPTWRAWVVPARLAVGSMAVTVGLVALSAWQFLGLSLGASFVLGAILAPTDPVLAAEVQVRDPWDRDSLRRALTAEAGLNDGTALAFLLLGFGLLGIHDIGPGGVRWLGLDVVYGTIGGLLVGAGIGVGLTRLVLRQRRRHGEAVGLDTFLTFGILAVTYGASLAFHVFGFLAVFAAGQGVRSVERRELGREPPEDARRPLREAATDQVQAPAYMAHALLQRTEQVERVAELGLVVLIGALLARASLGLEALAFAMLLVFAIRPVAVSLGLIGSHLSRRERGLTAWFGLRGVGSLYYLAHSVRQGLSVDDAERIVGVTLTAVAVSIVVHGVSATPLLDLHTRRLTASSGGKGKRREAQV